MKKLIIAALCFFFLIATASPAISKDYNRDNQGRPNYKERPDDKDRRDYRGQPDNRDRLEYRGRPDYRGNRGYRERPYDKHRYYEHQEYKGRKYTYHGHWRSWDQWDSYARQHTDIYKHGRYYRESGHLMFRFFEPGSGNFIFFSIGR
ncbi:MAG: hypothetical protein MUO88_18620 [Desulfobacterales bacterium]|nr:hypothetical protein [Desulfobacterales bacterium]